jgi:hypothetical protein
MPIFVLTKTENRKAKQVLSGCTGCQWEGEVYKERGSEGECGGNILYICIKMENETC